MIRTLTVVLIAVAAAQSPSLPVVTALIRGTVIDHQSEQPIARAIVTLSDASTEIESLVTDGSGRFAFQVPKWGPYRLSAAASGRFLAVRYGASRPTGQGTPVIVDQTTASVVITIRLIPAAVISGRVVDSLGEPVPLAIVKATCALPGCLPKTSGETRSDHEGNYRISGLAEGDYYVSGKIAPGGVGELRAENVDAILAAAGRKEPMTANRSTVGVTYALAATFFPGVSAAPARVRALAGTERANTDFAIEPQRTVSFAGVVKGPGTTPSGLAELALLPTGGIVEHEGVDSVLRARTDASGKFRFDGIPTGTYVLIARAGREETTRWVRETVVIGPLSDQTERVFESRPPHSLSGTITVMESPKGSGGVTGLLAMVTALSREFEAVGSGGESRAPLGPRGELRIAGLLPGAYRVAVGKPGSNWYAESLTVDAQDANDLPVSLGDQGMRHVVAGRLMDSVSEVTGTLVPPASHSPAFYTVLMFPANPSMWLPKSSRIRTTVPDERGRFSISGVPPGQYRVAAVIDLGPGEEADPSFLAAQTQASLTIALAAGKTHDVSIQVKHP